jgi:tetratricopeptide (TPR) repeat protein
MASLAQCADLAERNPECSLVLTLRSVWADHPGPGNGLRRDIGVLAAPDRGSFKEMATTGRTDALGRLLRLQEAMLGPDDPALVGVLTAQIRAAVGERRTAERADAALRAADILARQFGENDLSVLAMLDEASQVLVYTGRESRAVEVAQRACSIWDSIAPSARDKLLSADSRRFLAWTLALVGRIEESAETYRVAIHDLREAVGDEHHVVALAESGLAFCLQQLGDTAGADSLSSHALSLAQRLPAPSVDQAANIHFVRGHILCRGGRYESGRAELLRAWEPYYRVSGPMFIWRRMLLADLADACDHLGDPRAGASWLAMMDRDASDSRGP